MAEQFKNKATSRLAAAITADQTTITVDSATGFPTEGNFRIIVANQEIMTVTAVSGTTFTVTRASEECAGVQVAKAATKYASVAHVLTVGSLQQGVAEWQSTDDISVITGDTTITAAMSGNVFTNEGAAGQIVFTLPAAAAGLNYTFYVYENKNLRVQTATGDQIKSGKFISIVTGHVEADEVGSLIDIIAVNSSLWVVRSMVSAWRLETS